jgi:hypothetical protein
MKKATKKTEKKTRKTAKEQKIKIVQISVKEPLYNKALKKIKASESTWTKTLVGYIEKIAMK